MQMKTPDYMPKVNTKLCLWTIFPLEKRVNITEIIKM